MHNVDRIQCDLRLTLQNRR